MENKEAKWYVIQVISGTEDNVKQSLFQRRERFALEEYIVDVFVPSHDVVSIRAWGTKSVKKKNIFPGYILVQMVVTNESWYIVRNTPNVTWFLWAWNIPVAVSWEELQKLKWVLAQNSEVYSLKWKVGDTALITKWAFEWSEWIITEFNENKWYLKVNINMLWRDTPVQLDFTQVKIKS